MNLGIIGAGKLGFTLGKYFASNNISVIGYYSRTLEHSKEAARFVDTEYYIKLEELVLKCDTLFLTVSDDAIEEIYEKLITLDIKGKIICHTSGAKSSNIFKNISDYGAYGYSCHPIYAINDCFETYKTFKDATITIEGNYEHIDDVRDLFQNIGNTVKVIKASDKPKYHLQAVMSSNLVIGLINMVNKNLNDLNMDIKDFIPLIKNNIDNIDNYGLKYALTGPILRNDIDTIKTHLNVLSKEEEMIYKILSLELVKIAKEINNNDYSEIINLLGGFINEEEC